MNDMYQKVQIVSGAKVFRVVNKTVNPLGHYRSAPAEIESPSPSIPVQSPLARQHPAAMTSTVDVGVVPKEAANDSNLVTEYPPELPADQAQE